MPPQKTSSYAKKTHKNLIKNYIMNSEIMQDCYMMKIKQNQQKKDEFLRVSSVKGIETRKVTAQKKGTQGIK